MLKVYHHRYVKQCRTNSFFTVFENLLIPSTATNGYGLREYQIPQA